MHCVLFCIFMVHIFYKYFLTFNVRYFVSGNPRNKVALRPGHSLMDWVRLGNSGRDLTSVGGIPREVSPTELAKHNQNDDVWIAIKGRVYNVTHYLDFHPGGVAELMRGAGRDATKLFNQVHAWVNHEQILQKCLVGPLRGGFLFAAPAAVTTTSKPLTQRLFGKKSTTSVPEETKVPTAAPQSSVARSPRLDWFQQLGNMTLVLYSGMVPRGQGRVPPWVRASLDESGVHITILVTNVGGNMGARYVARLELHAPVRWPPTALRLQPDSGKVEVVFTKEKEALWPNFGKPAPGHGETAEPGSEPDSDEWWPCSLSDQTSVTHNTKLLTLQVESRLCFTLPVGCHFRVRVKGADISRSYTPIAPTLGGELPAANDCITLMVKRYDMGNLSSRLCDLAPGPEPTLEISDPIILFDARRVTSAAGVYLIAAGTGITPMLRVIALALQDSRRACFKVRLMFFNRTGEDIIWKDQVEKISGDDERFQVVHVLSDADSQWSGLCGRVSRELLETMFEIDTGGSLANLQPSPALVCVCGPEPFTLSTRSLLQEMELPEDQVHCFLG
ncbi:hypothetical protein B566_EDAN002949 [Ephemera danica]|nr:hypothetical protein B566_EDAN002949 [Ephemera danica]